MTDVLYSYNTRSIVPYAVLIAIGLIFAHCCIISGQGEVFQLHRNIIAFVGLIANIPVIYYHATKPPHPKFLLNKRRKVMVRLHGIVGSSELLVAVVAILSPSPVLGITLGVLAMIQALTSLWQTPSVFGIKAIMIPCYLMAGTLHAYVAGRLLMEPSSSFWIMNIFLTLNIYAFVRVFVFSMERTGAFQNFSYSIAVIASGFVVFPALMGSAAAVYMIAQILIFILVARYIFQLSPEQMRELWAERMRKQLISVPSTAMGHTLNNKEEDMRFMPVFRKLQAPSNEEKARKVFNELDIDRNGYIAFAELELLLLNYGLPRHEAELYLDRYAANDNRAISFDEFFKSFAPLWKFVYRFQSKAQLA